MSLYTYMMSDKQKRVVFDGEDVEIGDNRKVELSSSRDNVKSPDIASIRVEITTRKILRKKKFGIKFYDKIPVYRLVFNVAGSISYEEHLTHKDLYKRLVTEPIYDGKPFPSCVRINEFIDLGFSIMFV